MNFLFTIVLSAALVGPVPSIAAAEPDSGSVAFTVAAAWLRVSPTLTSRKVAVVPRGAEVRIIRCGEQACSVTFRRLEGYLRRDLLRASRFEIPPMKTEDALALLQAEHHFSFPLLLAEPPTAPR